MHGVFRKIFSRSNPPKLEEKDLNELNLCKNLKARMESSMQDLKALLPRFFLNRELHKDNIVNAKNQLKTAEAIRIALN